MNEQPPSYPISDDDCHVREPSHRGLYDSPNRHTYSSISPSDLEAGTAPVPKREWTKPLRDGFATFFQALARKNWTATFNDMTTAAEAFLKLAALLMVIVGVITLVVLIICVGIHFARQLLTNSFNGFGF
jgi:hypothetical protein